MVYPFYPILVEEIFNKFLTHEQHEQRERVGDDEQHKWEDSKKIFLYDYKKYREEWNETELTSQELSDSECLEFKSITDIINTIKLNSFTITSVNRFNNNNDSKQIRKDKFNLFIVCKTELIYTWCVKFYDFIQILSECQELSIQNDANETALSFDATRYKKIGDIADVVVYVEKILREDKVFRHPPRDNHNQSHKTSHSHQQPHQPQQPLQQHQQHQQPRRQQPRQQQLRQQPRQKYQPHQQTPQTPQPQPPQPPQTPQTPHQQPQHSNTSNVSRHQRDYDQKDNHKNNYGNQKKRSIRKDNRDKEKSNKDNGDRSENNRFRNNTNDRRPNK
jgi:hypothetical protein